MTTAVESPGGLTRWAERWKEIEAVALPDNLDAFLRDGIEKYADNVLIDFFERDETVTYAEFGELVEKFVIALAKVGVGPGDRVAAVMRSVAEFPATMYALARIGAVIVPVNFRYTAPEFEFVADDAEVSAIVAAAEFCEVIASAPSTVRLGPDRVIVVGGEHEVGTPLERLLEDAGEAPTFPDPALDTLISLQYTSGTTGFPKGCMLTHRYWLEAVTCQRGVLGPRYRILEDMPWFYMSGPIAFNQAIADGGRMLVPERPSLSKYLGWLHDQEVDFGWFADDLLKRPETPLDRDHVLKSAWVAGASPEVVEGLRQRFGIEARECYGMTEIGNGTLVPVEDLEMSMKGSIGVCAPFRQVRVVDERGVALPSGEVGELCFRGAGILQGYWKRPETNAEAFLPDGWFRTGDLARIDADGLVFYLGRIKDTIRRSGENISAAELEQAIGEAPGVAAVAALPVPDDFRGEEVKVYLVLEPGKTPDDVPPQAIFDWCEGRLASFKVPRYVEYVDELPLTPSEKVSKAKLREAKDDLREGSFDRVDEVWR